jgi:hypothetical protein
LHQPPTIATIPLPFLGGEDESIAREVLAMMIAGSVLLVLAALVVVAAAFCQLAGARLTAPLKVGLCAGAGLLSAAGLVALVVPGPTSLSAAPAPVPTPTEPLSDSEKATLTRMHRDAVEVFIDRPGFGVRRLLLPLEDVVKAPKTQPKKDATDKDQPPAAPVAARETDKAGKEAHYAVQDVIGSSDPLVGGRQYVTDDLKEEWKVRKAQLVGLVKHKEPVVYLAEKVPDMKEAKDVPTRDLDAFEKAALEAIRGGDNLKAEKNGKEMRALGPIYAGQRCLVCHATKGELLGAFSYQLERVPIEIDKERKPIGPRIP